MSSIVRDYYNAKVEEEWKRLTLPMCAIEYASTLRLIERYFPPRGHVVDIGSGPGRYALELRKRGHAVTLVEPAEKALAFAQEQFEREQLQAENFIAADARDLVDLDAGVFDAALLLGPLIHIPERAEACPRAGGVDACAQTWGCCDRLLPELLGADPHWCDGLSASLSGSELPTCHARGDRLSGATLGVHYLLLVHTSGGA